MHGLLRALAKTQENHALLTAGDEFVRQWPPSGVGYYYRAHAHFGLREYDAAWSDVIRCEALGKAEEIKPLKRRLELQRGAKAGVKNASEGLRRFIDRLR